MLFRPHPHGHPASASRTLRLVCWLALFAMLAAAFAPIVSRVQARAAVDGWVEVCSAAGTRWVRLEGASVRTPVALASAAPAAPRDGPMPPLQGLLDHCAYCILSADRLGPPPHAQAQLWVPGDAVVPGAAVALRSLSAAVYAAPARGPPAPQQRPAVA